MKAIKPPLGLAPKNLHLELVKNARLDDIKSAIQRYLEVNKEIPLDWLEEYNELLTIKLC